MASTHAHARSAWSGKWAFILAAAASAVGLGNMWRFPYLAAKYGGGTFLLTYLVLVFTFGVSLLLLETALGRKTGQSAIGAFKQFGKKYAFIGILASTVPFIITPYYCIIGGWVTKYAAAYLINGPEALADGGVACGLPRAKAQEYAAQMVLGSAKLVLESGKHPGELKDAVCSPGGSTIQGVRVLEEHGFRGAVTDAVLAAYDKTKEMGKG